MESLPEKTVVKLPLVVLSEWKWERVIRIEAWANKYGRFCARKINFKDGASGKDLANKALSSQSYGFSSSPVWMWELHHKESWALKNWCFWTVVLEKTLESLLYCKEIQPVHPKGKPSWILIGRTDAEAETPILWQPDAKNWLIGKDPDAGKDWRQEEKGKTEDEMVGWHHQLNRHEFEQVLAVGDGQGSLACCSTWGCRVRHDWATELYWCTWHGDSHFKSQIPLKQN